MKNTPLCACGCGQPTLIYATNNVTLGQVKGQPAKYRMGHALGNGTMKAGFWKHTTPGNPDECWEWQGPINRTGYGQYRSRLRRYLAHRASWEIHHGPIPDGLHVCHKCDNPPCVNPNHLFLGTFMDNMRDMTEKGRRSNPTYHGEDHPGAKVTADQVREIRRLADNGIPYPEIASHLEISRPQVSRIARRKSWKHLPD